MSKCLDIDESLFLSRLAFGEKIFQEIRFEAFAGVFAGVFAEIEALASFDHFSRAIGFG